MAKISDLSAMTGAAITDADDLITMVDASETGVAKNKKMTFAELALWLATKVTGLLDFKGSQDCSGNPNYPAALKGDYYLVSVAGKIGGASGTVVEAGDTYFAIADNAGGTQAGVGTSWTVVQGNITSYLPLSGGTLTGDLHVPDDAYDAATWNGSDKVPTKNAVRDKIEAVVAGAVTVDNDTTLAGDSATNVPSQHAAKTYTDTKVGAAVAGLSWKQAVRAATTANGTLASAYENGDTVDGVTLATGDRILLKNQTTGSENGIYTVNASGAPTRATDADSGAELVNATCYVSEGTANADTQWTCTTNATITINSTSLAFSQINTGSTPFASTAEVRAGSVSTKAIAPDTLQSSAAPQTLTDAAPTAWDMSLGYNAKWTLGASRTLSTPTNPVAGMTYSLNVIQDGTGSRLVTWPASFDWGTTGAPTLTTTANKRDRITLFCTDAATPKFDAFLSGKGFS